MLYFMDSEFNEDGRTIDLISIGIVAQDGRELYACSTDVDLERVQPWLKENVVPYLLPRTDPVWMTRAAIRDVVQRFIAEAPVGTGKPEFWAYYGASDWVAFYQLWGRLLDIPKGYPKWFHEVKQLAVDVGDPDLSALVSKPPVSHHALHDARWVRDVHSALIRIPRIP